MTEFNLPECIRQFLLERPRPCFNSIARSRTLSCTVHQFYTRLSLFLDNPQSCHTHNYRTHRHYSNMDIYSWATYYQLEFLHHSNLSFHTYCHISDVCHAKFIPRKTHSSWRSWTFQALRTCGAIDGMTIIIRLACVEEWFCIANAVWPRAVSDYPVARCCQDG